MAEGERVTIQTMAASIGKRIQNVGVRLGGPIMKQPTFNSEAEDKYIELKNVRLELNYIFKSCSMPQAEQIAIVKKNWLGRKGLQFLATLTQTVQENVTQQNVS